MNKTKTNMFSNAFNELKNKEEVAPVRNIDEPQKPKNTQLMELKSNKDTGESMSIYITRENKNKLDRYAKELDVSKSKIINFVIEKFLD